MVDSTGLSTDSALAALLRLGGASTPTSPSSSSTGGTATPANTNDATSSNANGATDNAANVDLSDSAKTLLQQTQADDATPTIAPISLRDQLTQRTNDLATKLTTDFTALKISQTDPITFKIDGSGNIQADGPNADKVEQYFKDNPDVAEQFKALSALHTMSAMQDVIRAFNAEKRAAGSDKDKQADAWDNYAVRSSQIQSLSGAFQLKDGKLTSATDEYAASLPGASTPSPSSTAPTYQATDISV